MQMEHDKPHANGLCHRPDPCVGALDTRGANEEKWFGRGRRFCWHTPSSGSPPSEMLAMETIVGNCCGSSAFSRSMPSSTTFLFLASSCLDGQYGDVAVIIDLASRGVCYLTRGKDYGLLDLPAVQARLALPPDQVSTHPETGTGRALFDCAEISLPGTGLSTRVIVATHPATSTTAPIGVTRDGIVYELFFTALPQVAFSPADVIDLYLHRGAFETVLGEEDAEQDSDRWVSQAPNGQEFWQIVSQWVWNLRLELGHHLDPAPVRLTEFAPAQPSAASEEADGQEDPLACTLATSSPLLTCDPHEDPADEQPALDCQEQPSAPFVYGPPQFTQTRRAGKFAGADFQLQPDGTLRCPANHLLYAEARRPEHDGTVRVLYAARLPDCRGCLLADHCLLHGKDNTGPRRVSAVIRPTGEPPPLPSSSWEPPAPATLPILWGD